MTTADQPGSSLAGHTPGTPAKLAVPRTRGLASGTVLLLLGIWGGLIPFIGPYFDYQADSSGTWVMTWDRFWLSVVPAVAVVVGGLLLGPAANKIAGALGAWIALAGGVWWVIAPTVSQLWTASGPDGTSMSIAEAIGFYYGLGAVVTTFAAFALGRMTVQSVRDVKD